MTTERFNTSRAVKQPVDIYNYDQLPISLTYTDPTLPGTPAIDITDVKLEFFLQRGGATIATYSIDKNVLSNTYLSKTGVDVNVLNMQPMWEDIRDNKITMQADYNLVQVVTDADDYKYVQVVYEINARNY